MYYDEKYAEKEVVFLDNFVNPEKLLEDISCVKKEINLIGDYLIKEIHKKFKVSLANNKQIVNNFIKNNKIKVRSHTLNCKSCNIMTLFLYLVIPLISFIIMLIKIELKKGKMY